MKKVQVNTPLILEQNGELVRIETGQVIELSDEVYAEVSAHTTLLDEMSDEPVFEPADEPVLSHSQHQKSKMSQLMKLLHKWTKLLMATQSAMKWLPPKLLNPKKLLVKRLNQ